MSSSSSSSSLSSSGTVRVYVGGLSSRVRIDDLETHFSSYRPLRVDLKNGFAFLEFSDRDTAADAIRRENGTRLLDDKIAVEMSRGVRRERTTNSAPETRRVNTNPSGFVGERKPRGYKIDVENLDAKTSWQDLKDFARTAGNVAFADVRSDRGMKVGVISYEAYDDYKHALRVLHDTKLHGQRVKLYPQRRSPSPRGRSRSPARRPSRSRSPAPRRNSRSRSRSPPPRRATSYSSRDRDASPRRRSPSPKRSSPKYEKYDRTADNAGSSSSSSSNSNTNGGSVSSSEYNNGNRDNERDRSPRD